ncbi:MAG TPA: ribulose-phosphate 3-epimerase [Firmicutes bacterium]|jgi:ribulose-phosphate 3-epimerase|nr:ribulose-phosphate 3-epimerase [Bacillota bacterium]
MISRKEIKIAASMACADFWRLEEQVRTLEKAKVDILHCDIMDGNFVPNFSLFPDFVTTLKENASIPVEVHMQIVNPERFIETFIDAGADSICFHIETIHNVHRIIQQIKLYGIRVGVSLNPSTHPAVVEYVLSEVDFLTVMAVDPGFYGQTFIPEVLEKIEYLSNIIHTKGHSIDIEVDGNMNVENARKCISAGANIIVAGTSSIFRATGNLEQLTNEFREAISA